MSILLKFKPFQTTNLFRFKDPDTGRDFSGRTIEEVVFNVKAYREQNSLSPLDELPLIIEHFTVSLPHNRHKSEVRKELKRGMYGFLRGGVVVVKNLFFGEENMVPAETADTRSEICASCPHNTFPDKTTFITWSDNIAELSTGGKRAKMHESLGNCSICSCPLRAKVFAKGPFKLKKQEYLAMPEYCWQKKEAKSK